MNANPGPETDTRASLTRASASEMGVAFVGTFPPRRCGIATFTSDLAHAMAGADERVQPMVIALTDTGGQYAYPELVKYEIRQGSRGDYARAAELVNYSDVRLVSEFESGVVAAVVAEVDVVGAGLGEGVVAGGELVAAGQ